MRRSAILDPELPLFDAGPVANPLRAFEPLAFEPVRGLPLLVLSCSASKAPTVAGEWRRLADLYDGPLWQDVRRSGFPLTNVAALSALHGFVEPGRPLKTYDQMMDADTSRQFCRTSDHCARLAKAIRTAGAGYIVGGKFYRAIGEAALDLFPDIRPLATFATGSFLQLRGQLNRWLRQNAP